MEQVKDLEFRIACNVENCVKILKIYNMQKLKIITYDNFAKSRNTGAFCPPRKSQKAQKHD